MGKETFALRPLVWKDFVCDTAMPNPPHRWHHFVSQYRLRRCFQVVPPQTPSPGQGNAPLAPNTLRSLAAGLSFAGSSCSASTGRSPQMSHLYGMDTQTRELVCPGAGQQQNGATSGCPAPSALTSLPTTLPSDTELPGEKKITQNKCI